jgi:hypothetical protein
LKAIQHLQTGIGGQRVLAGRPQLLHHLLCWRATAQVLQHAGLDLQRMVLSASHVLQGVHTAMVRYPVVYVVEM